MTWHEQARDFHRSDCGRFDVTYSHEKRAWVAVDWERGGKYVSPTLEDAKDWCAEQAQVKAKVKA